MMGRDQIERLRKLCNEAMPAPWYDIPHPEWPGANHRVGDRPDADWANFGQICYAGAHNAAFIVAARNAMTGLLDEIERQEEFIRWLTAQLHECNAPPCDDCADNDEGNISDERCAECRTRQMQDEFDFDRQEE